MTKQEKRELKRVKRQEKAEKYYSFKRKCLVPGLAMIICLLLYGIFNNVERDPSASNRTIPASTKQEVLEPEIVYDVYVTIVEQISPNNSDDKFYHMKDLTSWEDVEYKTLPKTVGLLVSNGSVSESGDYKLSMVKTNKVISRVNENGFEEEVPVFKLADNSNIEKINNALDIVTNYDYLSASDILAGVTLTSRPDESDELIKMIQDELYKEEPEIEEEAALEEVVEEEVDEQRQFMEYLASEYDILKINMTYFNLISYGGMSGCNEYIIAEGDVPYLVYTYDGDDNYYTPYLDGSEQIWLATTGDVIEIELDGGSRHMAELAYFYKP